MSQIATPFHPFLKKISIKALFLGNYDQPELIPEKSGGKHQDTISRQKWLPGRCFLGVAHLIKHSKTHASIGISQAQPGHRLDPHFGEKRPTDLSGEACYVSCLEKKIRKEWSSKP